MIYFVSELDEKLEAAFLSSLPSFYNSVPFSFQISILSQPFLIHLFTYDWMMSRFCNYKVHFIGNQAGIGLYLFSRFHTFLRFHIRISCLHMDPYVVPFNLGQLIKYLWVPLLLHIGI